MKRALHILSHKEMINGEQHLLPLNNKILTNDIPSRK